MGIAGTVYGFGVISPALKNRLNLSQTQVNIVATMGNFGVYVSIVPGIFNNHYGPMKTIIIGTVLSTCGWTLLTLITTQSLNIHVTNPYIIGIANTLYQHGNAWIACTTMPTIGQNFPSYDHGKVLGIVKSYFGISSAFFATFDNYLAHDKVDVFMFCFLFFVPSLVLIVIWFIRILPKQYSKQYQNDKELGLKIKFNANTICPCAANENSQQGKINIIANKNNTNGNNIHSPQSVLSNCDEQLQRHNFDNRNIDLNESDLTAFQSMASIKPGGQTDISDMMIGKNAFETKSANFGIWYLTSIVFATYLVTISIFDIYFEISYDLKYILFAIVIILWVMPIFNACCFHGKVEIETKTSLNSESSQLSNKNSNENDNDSDLQIGLPQIFAFKEYWLMFIIFVIVGGSALVVVNNISQIIQSIDIKHNKSNDDSTNNYDTNLSDGLVTMISFGNCIGRLLVGYVSDRLLHRVNRTFFIIVGSLSMCITQSILYCFLNNNNLILLIIGSIMTGVSYGWTLALVAILCCQFWGAKHLSGNYATLDTAPVIGSLIFATEIAARIYQHFENEENNSQENTCLGVKCWKYAFGICALANVVAVVLSLVLHFCSSNMTKRL